MPKSPPIKIPGNALVVYEGRVLRLTHGVKAVASRLSVSVTMGDDELFAEAERRLDRRASPKKVPPDDPRPN